MLGCRKDSKIAASRLKLAKAEGDVATTSSLSTFTATRLPVQRPSQTCGRSVICHLMLSRLHIHIPDYLKQAEAPLQARLLRSHPSVLCQSEGHDHTNASHCPAPQPDLHPNLSDLRRRSCAVHTCGLDYFLHAQMALQAFPLCRRASDLRV